MNRATTRGPVAEPRVTHADDDGDTVDVHDVGLRYLWSHLQEPRSVTGDTPFVYMQSSV